MHPGNTFGSRTPLLPTLQTPAIAPWAEAGGAGRGGLEGRGTLCGRMVGGEKWAQGGGGEAEEEVGKCKPNVGPGYSQEKQTLAGAWSGAPFRKGRKGWDRCLEKRKKERKEEV